MSDQLQQIESKLNKLTSHNAIMVDRKKQLQQKQAELVDQLKKYGISTPEQLQSELGNLDTNIAELLNNINTTVQSLPEEVQNELS